VSALTVCPRYNEAVPELPDVELYCHALGSRVVGARIERFRFASPFLLRSVTPTPDSMVGRTIVGVERLGKRIVLALEGGCFIVVHLMIAGRLQWKPRGHAVPGKIGLAALDFSTGTLIVTEAGSTRRASLHVVEGRAALADHDRGGIEPLAIDRDTFAAQLRRENHTLKRSLTDPRLFSGIGNAYSDEILHAAQLSPLQWTSRLADEEIDRLFEAARRTLSRWVTRLQEDAGDRFPEKVTAFRPDMAVHGRYGKPCPVCGDAVQRITYAANECNYCATCQTGGKLLADRSLSRLLRDDWPRTLEELEKMKSDRR
jgi:formamidopyrimidine-DNA glycosylase